MKRAKIAELKNNLSSYLDHVRAGGSVLVLDRDQPIAQIVPLGPTPRAAGGSDERLIRLERRGIARRGKGGLPPWLGRPRLRQKGGLLKEFLAERRRGW
jgi:antitoxin (DNA-binding transcriptional repressor) of toxin-antitoxin stability system